MAAEDERDWRGVVNGVLYVVQFEAALDEEVAAVRARHLRERPLFDLPVPRIAAALRAALASGLLLSTGIPQPHDEPTVRTYLTRLATHLETP